MSGLYSANTIKDFFKLNISYIENGHVVVVQMMHMPTERFDRVVH